MTNVLARPIPTEACGPAPEALRRALAPADAERLRALARCQEVAAGAELWRQGSPATSCMVVASGTAEVHRGGRRAGRLEPGAFAGVAPILARRPHTTSVVAATPLTVWWLDGDALERLVLEAPTFSRLLVRRLARATVAAGF
jgi:CRP-like cAMP-binding protein